MRIAILLPFLVLAPGCVEGSPIVTLGRDGGEGLPSPEPPPGDLPPSDPPDCLSCDGLLRSSLRRGACAGSAKPSSAELVGGYVSCVCQRECTSVCALHCDGAPREPACAACVSAHCAAEERACRADVTR